tara:strand:+ start:2313 stop:2558 length:246 start_codon:yes stop_codon:yes gene_type:complete
MVKLSDPEVPFDPCQEPEAEHDVAFDELHDSVIGVDSTTDDDEALKVTIGSGLTGSGVDPPPPPPPHAVIKKIERIRNGYF